MLEYDSIPVDCDAALHSMCLKVFEIGSDVHDLYSLKNQDFESLRELTSEQIEVLWVWFAKEKS
jgi:hypothetical protein